MRVMVTGGAGFIGSHIVDLFVKEGCQVSILDNLSTGRIDNLNPKAELYQVDITDYQQVEEALSLGRPEVVIHHAAQVDVTTSLWDPLRDGLVNVLGSINLFQKAFQVGAKRIIYASSAAVYGDPTELPLQENSTIEPLSPYGISKYTPEHYLRILAAQRRAGYTILRYANVYGPRQNSTGEGGVVAIFADRLTKGEAVTIYGDGEQTRDFVWVKDVAAANLAAATGRRDGVFNISTGKRVSINDLLRLCQEVSGKKAESRYAPGRPGDIDHSLLNPSKAQIELGWTAQTELIEGLKETWEFFRIQP